MSSDLRRVLGSRESGTKLFLFVPFDQSRAKPQKLFALAVLKLRHRRIWPRSCTSQMIRLDCEGEVHRGYVRMVAGPCLEPPSRRSRADCGEVWVHCSTCLPLFQAGLPLFVRPEPPARNPVAWAAAAISCKSLTNFLTVQKQLSALP
jgi:hypothetical protein